MSNKLTIKQEAFVKAYIETGNASEAYRRAYPSSTKWKPEAVHVKASQLLANDKVKVRVAEIQAAQQKRFEITQDRWLAEYRALAFADISEAINWGETIIRRNDAGEIVAEKQSVQIRSASDLPPHVRAAISSIKQTKDGGLEIKFHNKQPALDAIGKHFGWFEKDNKQKGEAAAEALVAGANGVGDLARAIIDVFRDAKVEGVDGLAVPVPATLERALANGQAADHPQEEQQADEGTREAEPEGDDDFDPYADLGVDDDK